MLSRVADSLYWMSRYIERAEYIARLLDVNVQLLLDFQALDDAAVKEHWLPILRSAGAEEQFFGLYPRADSGTVTEFMTYNRANPSSVLSCVAAARENARMIRDQISSEMWEVLNRLYLLVQEGATARAEGRSHEIYQQIRDGSHLFQGVTDAVFPRGEGYQFIRIGRCLERADKTSRLLDLKYHILLPRVSDVGGAVDAVQWAAVLRSCSALEAYHRTYVSALVPWKIAELLILSTEFPRSVRFCLAEVESALADLMRDGGGTQDNEAERLCRHLLADLGGRGIQDIFQSGLHEQLGSIQTAIVGINRSIFDSYMLVPAVDRDAEIQAQQQVMQQQQACPVMGVNSCLPKPLNPATLLQFPR